MPKYSFSSYKIPSYLFIDDVNTNDDRSILFFDGLSLQPEEEILFHHPQSINNITFFTEDETLLDTAFTLAYTLSSSPSTKNLFIYPNPITDKNISITYFSNEMNDVPYIKIYDLLGKVVLSASIHTYNNYYYNGNININLPSGIYIVKVFGFNVENEFEIVTVVK